MKNQRGFAAVYVTHDQEEAMALADVLAVMQDGEIRQLGTPWEIYRRPKNLYVAHFVGEANTMDARVKRAEGGTVIAETVLGDIKIAELDPVPRTGEKGQVVLRPEDIRVVGQPSGSSANMFSGKVVNSVLLGPRVELHLVVGNTLLRGWTELVTRDAHPLHSDVSVESPPQASPGYRNDSYWR